MFHHCFLSCGGQAPYGAIAARYAPTPDAGVPPATPPCIPARPPILPQKKAPRIANSNSGAAKPYAPTAHRRSLSITNYQLSITNYPLSIINYQLPITNYQLPIIHYQLINYQLSIIHYPLSIIHYPLFSSLFSFSRCSAVLSALMISSRAPVSTTVSRL